MTKQYTFAPHPPGPANPPEAACAAAAGDADDALAEEANEAVERRRVAVSVGLHGMRLDKTLVTMAGEFSRNHLQSLIDGGHVSVDGAVQSLASRKVRAGQIISVELMPTLECRAFTPQAMSLPVVFEDEHLIVIDKPAGWVVHPAPGNWSGTLLNGLLAHHADAATLPRAGIVHRLDKDTSGLMVVGKTLPAVTALSRQIAAREVHRIYLAICHGQLAHKTLRIEAPIGRDAHSRVRMAVVPAGGRAARTDVERIAIWQRDDGASLSAVRCTLHTGRTHQSRVHLASVGHPLLSDSVYGGHADFGLLRQALHATRLAFDHPFSGKPVAFEAAPPPDFSAVWQQVCGALPG